MSLTPEEKSLTVEDCHFVTDPTFPVKLKLALFVPVHKEVLPNT